MKVVIVGCGRTGSSVATKLAGEGWDVTCVDEAAKRKADLIVLGSSPRWRRQSRFFSPTVDHVLRHAPCEVLVVAFPDGVFDQ